MLSREVSWQVTPLADASARTDRQSVTQTALTACAFAALIVYVVVRSKQRAHRVKASAVTTDLLRDEANSRAVRDELQALADAESSQ